jgi:hypothetical protein
VGCCADNCRPHQEHCQQLQSSHTCVEVLDISHNDW